MFQLSTCVVDLVRRIVTCGDRSVRLTVREAELFAYLSAREGQVVTRETLLREVWGHHREVLSRATDNTVARLRAKIEADPLRPVHVLTEAGGYRFVTRSTAVVPALVPDEPPLLLSGGAVDLTRGTVTAADRSFALTANELALLRELVRTAGPPIEARTLERRTWGRDASGPNRLRHTVCQLRAKIESDPSTPRHLLSLKGHGYRFVLPEAAPAAGRLTVLVARALVGHPEAQRDAEPALGRLLTAATDIAARNAGYLSSLSGGRVCVVFARADTAVRAALQLDQQLAEVQLGLATGEARRYRNPLTRRFEYVGSPVDLAEVRCRRLTHPGGTGWAGRASQAVFADQASERVTAP